MKSPPSKERIQSYVESLKSQIQTLEASLQDGGTPEELAGASKTVILYATLMDEMISRPICKNLSFSRQVPDNSDAR